jgi:hypothetical protein
VISEDGSGAGFDAAFDSSFGGRLGWFDEGLDGRPEDGSAVGPEAGPDTLDSLVMDARDRLTNLAFFAGAGVVWILVALVLTKRDPSVAAAAGFVGALLIGLAAGLTLVPLFWLAIFARHRRIAYRGDWTRAVRRGGWVAVVTTVFVILRLQGAFVPALALFILALVILAEAVLSVER